MAESTVYSTSNEELRQNYHTLLGKVPEIVLTRESTALMVIDVQYGDAHPDYGLGAKAKELGLSGALDYYWDRLKHVAIPNIQRLLATARQVGVEVVHVRVASQTKDGRDSTLHYKAMGRRPSRDSKDAEILPEVAPQGDELVIDKLTSSPFNSTNIDRVLRNIGIQNVILTGVVTNGCVDSTARSVVERDYGTIIVEDATASFAAKLHEGALHSLDSQQFASIRSTDEVIKQLESL